MSTAIETTERAYLGALLLRPQDADAIIGLVGEDDFANPHHRTLYVALCRMFDRGESTGDLVALERQLAAQDALGLFGGPGLAGIGRYTDSYAYTRHYERNARAIREAAAARRLRDACAEVVHVFPESAEDPQGWVDAQAAFLGPHMTGVGRPVTLLSEGSAERLRRIVAGESLPFVPSGFRDLDALIVGIHGLTILAARPKHGKSALALRVAKLCGFPCIYFSLEMLTDEQYVRLLADESDVEASKLVHAARTPINPGDRERLERARHRLDALTLSIVERDTMTITEIRSTAREFLRRHAKGTKGLVIIDYLQLVRGTQRHTVREQEVAEISRGLKALSTETRCPVLALSQLNRDLEKREDKRPRASDLRESGALEQDANCILMLWRPELYEIGTIDRRGEKVPTKGIAEAIIEKQRNGPTASVLLRFDGTRTRFTDRTAPDKQERLPT